MQTFTKAERLSGKIAIDELYKKGRSISSFSFKINLLEVSHANVPVKVLISVPKRLFKKAVDRNKIKRHLREAYRKNKTVLYKGLDNKKIFVMFIYTSKTTSDYYLLEKEMVVVMQKICYALKNLQ